ncbi:MAG: methylated-DNA--[protein]-cysteine S-methyltransferase [Alistipes sp.]|nr:methylated-DNA--[protein]-cysteine S-methyltransferase [Alistipes sp.]
MENKLFETARVATPTGEMVAGASGRGICYLGWADGRHHASEMEQLARALGTPPVEVAAARNPHLAALAAQLAEYFDGRRREFDLPLDPIGTPFQRRVWDALARIPYGTTASYSAQAAAMGCPRSVRAVANANGRNKISIVLPCHRVTGSDGSLTGYGGGLERKAKLIFLEQIDKTNRP